MNPRRVHILRMADPRPGPVVYWMHRYFRAADNWGLTHARLQALMVRVPPAVVLCLAGVVPGFAETPEYTLGEIVVESDKPTAADVATGMVVDAGEILGRASSLLA